MAPQKVDKKFSKETGEMERGVKGMLPACCLPLWGREGVTFIAFLKKMASDRISPEQKNITLFPGFTENKTCIAQELIKKQQ